MTVAYAVMAALSLVLLLGYCILVKKKEFWLVCDYFNKNIKETDNRGEGGLPRSKTIYSRKSKYV